MLLRDHADVRSRRISSVCGAVDDLHVYTESRQLSGAGDASSQLTLLGGRLSRGLRFRCMRRSEKRAEILWPGL